MSCKLLIFLVLAGMPAVSYAKVKLNLVRSPACGRGCAIDTVERATFELQRSSKRGARGLVGRVRIAGARKAGRPVTVTGLLVVLPLRLSPDECTDRTLVGLDIEDGQATFRFAGSDVLGSTRLRPGTVVPICGTVRIVPRDVTGYAPVLVAGLVLDAQRGRPRGVSRMDLLVDPSCGPDCPITRVGKSSIAISSGGEAGDELAVKVHIRGARKDHAKATMAAYVDLAFLPDARGICWHVGVPDVAIRRGRFVRSFAAANLTTSLPFATGMVLSPCTAISVVSDPTSESPPVLSAGGAVGRDPDPEAQGGDSQSGITAGP